MPDAKTKPGTTQSSTESRGCRERINLSRLLKKRKLKKKGNGRKKVSISRHGHRKDRGVPKVQPGEKKKL